MKWRTSNLALWFLGLLSTAIADEAALIPGRNLILRGVPQIPKSIAREAARYNEYRSAKFLDWHPLKRELLIRTRFANTPQIHHVAKPGGARTQITYFDEPVYAASYEPLRGDYFVFAKDTGGDEFYQIYRFDQDSGGATLLSDGKSQHLLGPWSNDRKWLIFHRIFAESGQAFSEIYRVDPGRPRSKARIARLAGGGWLVTDWSPDDQWLLAQEVDSINQSRVWMIEVATGKKKALSQARSEHKVAYINPRFSRDGKAVYVASDRGSEFLELTKIDLDRNTETSLSRHIPWDVTEIALSPKGEWLAFLVNEAGVSRLRLLDTASDREIKAPDLPDSWIERLYWRADGKELGFTSLSARSPGDVFSLDILSGRFDQWTFSETGGIDPENFVEPRLIRWEGVDKRTISGLYYAPPSSFRGPRPVIIYLHGGPERQARLKFNGPMNYFIDRHGIALIEPNVRGSSGFGKTFLQLDDGFQRVNAYRDLDGLFDWIAKNPDLDAERVMVTGFSYGGHMTLAAATMYDARICCSVDVVGIGNLRTFLENTQGYRRDLRRAEYGDERLPEMRAFLDKIAPINHAGEINKPMLVVQGENDPRVPKSESEQMVRTLERNGTPVWYIVAKDEGHGFRKKKNADFQFYATIKFVQDYLLAPRDEKFDALDDRR